MSTVDKRLDSPDRPSVEHSTVENVITRQPQADEFRPPDGIHGMTVREGGGVLMLTSDPTQPQTPPSQHTIYLCRFISLVLPDLYIRIYVSVDLAIT